MKERYISRALMHLALLSFTAALQPAAAAQSQVEGCTETDSPSNTVLWASKEEGITVRINPDPDSETIGIWPRGTKLITQCYRPAIVTVDGYELSTILNFVRAEGDEGGGWLIPFIDRPGISPVAAGLPPPPDPVWTDEDE